MGYNYNIRLVNGSCLMKFPKARHNGTAISTAKANFKIGYKLIFLITSVTKTTMGGKQKTSYTLIDLSYLGI
jgi:hypothetical protein